MAMFDVGYHEIQIGDFVTCLDGIVRTIHQTQITTLADGTWVDVLVFGDGTKLLPFNHISSGVTGDWRFAVSLDEYVPEISRYEPRADDMLKGIVGIGARDVLCPSPRPQCLQSARRPEHAQGPGSGRG